MHKFFPMQRVRAFRELDLSELDQEARERLLVTVQRAIDKACTVGRTLEAGTKVTLSFDVEV